MRFLPGYKKEDVMLVNVIYHSPRKDTDWVDYLDIIYKDLKTGEKHVETLEGPEIDIFFAKENFRNYDYNKEFLELEEAEMHTCKYKDLPFYIAKQAGPNYVSYLKDCIEKRNRSAINNIHKYKYVFGSDYDIENWYKIRWFLDNHHENMKPITKQFLDIEVDTIDIEGFPRDGQCPINAVTLVDADSHVSYTFLLRNPKNPLIQDFEDRIEEFVRELHEDFDETYGVFDYRFYMYDDERDLVLDVFRLINTLKRDFLLIWNGHGFDIPYIIARCKELGLDPVEVMCHKDFKVKEMFFKKDTKNYQVQNKGDYFKISAYTYYADQMQWYGGLRKGQGELRSYALNFVAKKEIGDEKLDYGEDANIKTLPYVDYWKFVKYNIKDVLLQYGIENKTGDVDNIYQRAYTNATSYHKIFKQTVFLKNRAYIEFIQQGVIIGNNTNVEYGVEQYAPLTDGEEEEEDEKFDGALVANPTLNSHTGIQLFGAKSMYVYDNVVDMDFSSMYPNIIIAFNISPNCMIGKLIINREIREVNVDIEGKVEDLGKEFMDNLLVGNVANMGTKWFGLPPFDELHALVKDHFNLNNTVRINMNVDDVNKLYAESLVIDIA